MSIKHVFCRLILLACLAMGHGILMAQDAVPSEKTYASGEVNLEFSRVFILTKKTGLGHDHAIEGKLLSGTLHMPSGTIAPTQSDSLVFDMRSFDADGSKARKYVGLSGETDENTRKQVNANMLGKDVLNVKQFPKAEFKLASIVPKNEPQAAAEAYTIQGDFTLHGVTKPVTFSAKSSAANGWIHLHGQFNILQTDYGIKPYTKAFGAVGVADELTIYGDLFIAP